MLLRTLKKQVTVQGDIILTLWSKTGDALRTEAIQGTEDIELEDLQFWNSKTIKYIFADQAGFLHIDFEQDE